MRRLNILPTTAPNLNFLRFSSSLSATTPLSPPPPRCHPYPHPPSEDPQRAFVDLLRNSSRGVLVLSEIESLHSVAIRSGLVLDGQVGIGLLSLYAKCRSLDLAHKLFDEVTDRDDAMTWTILISGYSGLGRHEMGLSLFAQMIAQGYFLNRFTLAAVFKCCLSLDDLRVGKGIHGWMLKNGVEMDVVLENTIVDFYAKCGPFGYAKRVFEMMDQRDAISWNIMMGACLEVGDAEGSIELFRTSPVQDVSSWNTIISGLMRGGHDLMAIRLLYEMVETGLKFSQFTFSLTLTLASKLALHELGRQVHCQILRFGYENDSFIRNSLIDMYCKCGDMVTSSVIFNNSSQSIDGSVAKIIQWSSMIAGYVQNGMGGEALKLFSTMLRDGLNVDRFTLTSISSACSDAGILEQGRQVHACIEKLGYGFDVFLVSSITDMYAKCGSLEDARKAFDTIYSRNVVLWTSVISSYASHGRGREAIQLFEKMLDEKITPNEITFVSVLSACSHSGLIKEGYKYFRLMQEDYGIVPSIEHFTCMVDLLGRAGQLDEAKDFIYQNDIGHQAVVWKAFLSACRFHNNIEMAIWASEQLTRLKPSDAGTYVMLSNIYATKRKFMEATKLRSLMRDRQVNKEPGQSWIQLKNKFHVFVVGDRSHPEAEAIYSYLERLMERLKELGYHSRTDLVLQDVEEEQRESLLNFHSEKLAVAYGIISTPSGTPLRVMKNLRVCVDCHEAIKYISQVTSREIVLRDAYRFHHFKNGECSCRDYW